MSRFGTRSDEEGLDAVTAKYGPLMADQIRNWPKLAEVYARAECQDSARVEAVVSFEVEQAKGNVDRAKRDRDYALQQAETIARVRPKQLWGVVPSVAQLRREWFR